MANKQINFINNNIINRLLTQDVEKGRIGPVLNGKLGQLRGKYKSGILSLREFLIVAEVTGNHRKQACR